MPRSGSKPAAPKRITAKYLAARIARMLRRQVGLMHQRMDHLGEPALPRPLMESVRQHRSAALHGGGIGLEHHGVRLRSLGEVGESKQERLEFARLIFR